MLILKNKYFLICFLIVSLSFPSISQNVKINEVMSSNASTITDEDGEFPDWIEIFNADISAKNLDGYYLSDDTADIFQWQFPKVILEVNDYLLLFASDKDRRYWANHWETVVNWGDTCKYRIGTSEPPVDWNQVVFDDSLWSSGPSGFGYGDGDDSTIVSQTISLYLRKNFTVADITNIQLAQLHVDYDDAFVAYLNGVEIARRNIGQPGIPPPFDQLADELHEAEIYQGGLPEFFNIADIKSLLNNGNNVLAIQVHNYVSTSSDMTIIPFFSIGMVNPPANPNGMADLIKFSIPQLHTNFKIKSEGETILLSDSLGNLVDSLNSGYIPADISLGRQPDGSSNLYFFNEATPGSSNTTVGFTGIVPEPQYSQNGGFYSGSVIVSLSDSLPGAEIRYTTDGSDPVDTSALFQNDLAISQTTVVRAKAFSLNMIPSRTITNTYFINENYQLPLISISTTPANLWDYNTGIYVMGPNAEPNYPYFGANFWQDWERPIHIEFYEPDATLGFSIDAGVKIFGSWSRGHPQKSLSIFARGKYGYSEINYQIFPDKPIQEFQAFILRNSGNDWESTMFRDAMMTGLVEEADIDIQAYRPAIVFLNGEFWGIHNVREKMNEHYLDSNHDVDPDNVDLLELDGQIIEGDANHYEMLIDFLETQDICDSTNYEYVKTQMDVDNFINYQVSEIYFDNTDWPGNNLKYWRSHTPAGKWRWLLYDTDFGFGMYNPSAYTNNTLEFATEPNGPVWPNPPWSTFILRKLLENNEFEQNFINRFADYLNYYFEPNRVIQKINEINAAIEPDIAAHFVKWGGNIGDWNADVYNLKVFAAQRPNYVKSHIRSKFNLSGNYQLTLNVNQPGSGTIEINSLQLETYPWVGTYFNNIPIRLTALPADGYIFKNWSGASTADSTQIIISSQSNLWLTAVFEIDTLNNSTMVINEINYNSNSSFDTEDWIEFVNNSDSQIDMSGWQFKDSEDDHIFTFPQNSIIEPDSFVVICRDSLMFFTQFPTAPNFYGVFDFGFSGGGELLRLYDSTNTLIDSLTYDDNSPWPTEPDGDGPTLALKNPSLDNSQPGSWAASGNHGTPGKINDVYTSVSDEENRKIPQKFRLLQNYPNPFNPDTKISFELPEKIKVKLEVFDLLGRRIEIINDSILDAGYHEYEWRPGQDISSGVYFYKIIAGENYIKTLKMVYLK